MKKLLLILLCLPFIGFGQSDIEKTYYENGNLQSEITTLNGISNGIAKLYYESGKIRTKGFYIDGKENGIWNIYYENEILKIEGEWKDSKPNGIWKYYDEYGQLVKISKYLNGKLINENWL